MPPSRPAARPRPRGKAKGQRPTDSAKGQRQGARGKAKVKGPGQGARQQLHVGTYAGARFRGQSAPQLDGPGFAAFRGTRADGTQACADAAGDTTADFTVTELVRAADGTITAFDASFVLRCSGPAGPVTTGEVHFHA